MKILVLFSLLYFLPAPADASSYTTARRHRELREQYGTSSPTWGMLSSSDKIGTAFVGLVLVVLVLSKLRE